MSRLLAFGQLATVRVVTHDGLSVWRARYIASSRINHLYQSRSREHTTSCRMAGS